MKNLLKKSAPVERRKQSGALDNRWLGWARSLAGRHSRVAANGRGSSLMFLRLATPLFSYERWSRATWTIAPQINLSIGPILRSLQPSRGDESAGSRKAEREIAPLSPRLGADSGGKTIVERWDASPRIGAIEHVGDFAANLRAFAATPQGDTPQKPLQRVFARAMVEGSGETAPASRAQRETLLIARSLRIARQVVDERRRVEELARRALVAREQRGAPQTMAMAAQESVMQSPRGLSAGSRGMTQTTAPPIDIEQLTDRVVRNIDSRIIAHRERMGKLF